MAHAFIAYALAQATVNTVAASASRAWRDIEARAAQSAALALALDPNASLAYVTLGNLDEIAWRWADARRNYARAYDLNPNDPVLLFRYAWFSSFTGAPAEGLRLAERGRAATDGTGPSRQFECRSPSRQRCRGRDGSLRPRGGSGRS